MKVQYQIVDIETKKAIPIGEVFELVDFMKTYFDKGKSMSWLEAIVICGEPLSIIKNPVGIIGKSPIKVARESVGMEE